MDWAAWFDGPRCRTCGSTAPRDAFRCPDCDGFLRADGDGSVPIDGIVSTGGTPMVASEWLADACGAARVLVKDEGRNPTGHVSDRDMAIAAGAATLLDVPGIDLVSPGRTGVAAAAAGARHELDVAVHVPSRTPFPCKAMINVHGGDMTVVGGRYGDAAEAYARDRDGDHWAVDPMTNPYARAGRGTVYEGILDALDRKRPDVLVVPMGLGAGAVAIADAVATDDGAPRLVLATPAGCAPLADAVATDRRPAPVSSPDTICGELEIADPPGGMAALAAVRRTGGAVVPVPDPAALEAAVRLANGTGISASVAGGVAAAAATDLAVSGDETVVVLNPGAGGLDADVLRSHLMGQGV